MNRRTICTALITAMFIPLISMAKPDLTITFSECFLKYNTMNGETEIILYNVKPSHETKLTKDVFKDVFSLSEFEITDLMFSEPGTKPTAIRVLARTRNFMMNKPVEQLFSNMLNTKAEVDMKTMPPNMTMDVLIQKQEHMYMADNNAKKVLQSEDGTTVLLQFDLSDFPSKPIEAVVGWKDE